MSPGARSAVAIRRGTSGRWLRRAGRVGLVSRGVVYGVVGTIALQIAWGEDRAARRDASKDGALRIIAERSGGRLLLVVLASGLVGYLAWRVSEAVWGRRGDEGEDGPKPIAKQIASAGKAIAYVTVLASTVRLVVSGPDAAGGPRSSERGQEALTARALGLPGGRLLVGALGVVLLGVAVYLVVRGITQRFEKHLDTADMGPVAGRAVDVVGTLGHAARGLVVGVIGWLLLRSALDFDPREATGIDGTLRLIARQPYGQGLLTLTGAGIIAYGLYSLAEARYRDL